MNMRQIIFCSTFLIIHCKNLRFSTDTITVQCEIYKLNESCAQGYKIYKKNMCISSVCKGHCNAKGCQLRYCYGFKKKHTVYDSKCDHFLSSNNCSNCSCYKSLNKKVCICSDGYIINPKNQSECVPFCTKKCIHGRCSATETCSCDQGYKISSDNYKCMPLRCSEGYILRNSECKPDCKPECEGGECIAPNQCECHEHYTWNNATSKCETKCDCNSGRLLDSGICRCNDGNKLEPNNKCNCATKLLEHTSDACSESDLCNCDMDQQWNVNTAACEFKCGECINGILSDGMCTCKEEYDIDPNNKCICIPMYSVPYVNNCYSESGPCICRTNYTWNENTSKCEWTCNNCVSGMCIKINTENFFCVPKCKDCNNYVCTNGSSICNENHEVKDERVTSEIDCENNCVTGFCVSTENETVFCKPKCQNCLDYMCENDSAVCNANSNTNIKILTGNLKCDDLTGGLCKNVTCTSNEISIKDKNPAEHELRNSVTCICNDNYTILNQYSCEFTYNQDKTYDKCNSNGSCKEKIKDSEFLLITMYVIPICVTLFVVILIVTGIIIRNTLKKRKLSTNPEGGTSTSTLQKKSDDEEIVENVELYGSI